MAGDSPRPVTLDRNELGALPVAAAVGAQRFLLFTRNSNPGKSVENSTWAGRVWTPLGRMHARLADSAKSVR